MTEANIAPATLHQTWVKGKGSQLGGHQAARLGEGEGKKARWKPPCSKAWVREKGSRLGEGERK